MKYLNLIKMLSVAFLSWFSMQGMVMDAAAAPAPTARAGAEIIVTLRNVPAEDKANVDGKYTVSQVDGTISLPYLSSGIKAQGKTARQLEDLIKAKYVDEQIYTHPIVSVQVGSEDEIKALNQRYVQVTGYVARKSNLPYRPDMTLISALVDCGDITDYGSRYIQVTRRGQTRIYDYFSARDRAIKLQPNDVINVNQRGAFEGRPGKVGP